MGSLVPPQCKRTEFFYFGFSTCLLFLPVKFVPELKNAFTRVLLQGRVLWDLCRAMFNVLQTPAVTAEGGGRSQSFGVPVNLIIMSLTNHCSPSLPLEHRAPKRSC